MATSLTASPIHLPVWRSGITKIVYNIDTIVATAGNTVFELVVPSISGRIHEISFESVSTNIDVSILELDAKLATSHYSVLWLQNINTGYSPELSVPRYYHNRDTVNEATLYARLTNNTGGPTVAATTFLSLTLEAY